MRVFSTSVALMEAFAFNIELRRHKSNPGLDAPKSSGEDVHVLLLKIIETQLCACVLSPFFLFELQTPCHYDFLCGSHKAAASRGGQGARLLSAQSPPPRPPPSGALVSFVYVCRGCKVVTFFGESVSAGAWKTHEFQWAYRVVRAAAVVGREAPTCCCSDSSRRSTTECRERDACTHILSTLFKATYR